jgi:hypothetical protein
MKSTIKLALAMALVTAPILMPLPANANVITFDLSYSGASFQNSATGTGFISFDDTVLPNTATSLLNVSPATLGIVGFSITIANASSGDGTFGLSDFTASPNGWLWNLTAPLNLGADLVGQAGFSDFNWCAITASCGSATAPGGVAPFTIQTDGETEDKLLLTSMTAAVPEPSTWAMMLLGFAGVSFMAYRRSRKDQGLALVA